MNRYQPLVPTAAAVCGGIVADRLVSAAALWWWGWAVAALLVWGLLFRRRRMRCSAAVLLVAVALSAAGWHHVRWSTFAADDIGTYAAETAQPVKVRATLLESPRRLPAGRYSPFRAIPQYDRATCTVRVEGLFSGGAWRPTSGRALLAVEGHLLGVGAGDAIEVHGNLVAPAARRNPGGFDRADWMRARRVRAVISAEYPHFVTVRRRQGRWWLVQPTRWFAEARRWCDGRLRARFEGADYALAAALLLGSREHLSQPAPETASGMSLRESFVRTGTVHLLAISGLHVGIVAALAWFGFFLGGCSQRTTAVGVALTVFFYALLTETRPPVVRAAILVCLAVAAPLGARKARFANSLAAALIVVLALNPADLFNIGLQLSFLTAGTFVWVGSKLAAKSDSQVATLNRLMRSAQGPLERLVFGSLRYAFGTQAVCMVVWVVLSPLLLARFHLLSPMALLLNGVILPIVGGVLAFGFLMLGCDLLMLEPAARLFAWLTHVCLQSIEWLVQRGSELRFGHFYAPGPPDWWLAGLYGAMVLLAVLPWLQRRRFLARWLCAVAVWTLAGLAVSLLRPATPGLRCTFLSVGHGLAAVVHLPDGRTLLYDAGNLGEPESASRMVAEYLWSRGIGHIDGIVLSHADVDHYNAVPGLLERFSVGQVFVAPSFVAPSSRGMGDDDGEQSDDDAPDDGDGEGSDNDRAEPPRAVAELLRLLERKKIPLRFCREGSELIADPEVRLRVLHPPAEGTGESDNADSIVLAVEYAGRRLLLTGDLEGKGFVRLLSGPPLEADVLLAPHHGSAASNPPGLARWCHAKLIVVSQSGAREAASAVQAYRAAGVPVVSTAEWGAVEVVLRREGVEARRLVAKTE